MSKTLQSILYIISSGIVLFVGIFLLKYVLRYIWKVLRAALIMLVLITIAGYFLGFFEFALH